MASENGKFVKSYLSNPYRANANTKPRNGKVKNCIRLDVQNEWELLKQNSQDARQITALILSKYIGLYAF